VRVTILYFASVREAMGKGEEVVDIPADVATLSDLCRWLAARGDALFGETKGLRAAVNQRMAELSTSLSNGAEVAFFPPVTGG
jgi:sulfur-carrier protein